MSTAYLPPILSYVRWYSSAYFVTRPTSVWHTRYQSMLRASDQDTWREDGSRYCKYICKESTEQSTNHKLGQGEGEIGDWMWYTTMMNRPSNWPMIDTIFDTGSVMIGRNVLVKQFLCINLNYPAQYLRIWKARKRNENEAARYILAKNILCNP